MVIGQAAKFSGLSIKTIRYYESVGLIEVQRRSNGYRDYSDDTVKQLRLLQRTRSVGFALEESRALLDLLGNKQRHSREVKQQVENKIAQIDQQIHDLQQMRDTLEILSDRCANNEDAECQILTDLSDPVHPMPFTLVGDPRE